MGITDLIDRYCDAWSEADPARREDLLASIWCASATYTDPTVGNLGRMELLSHIARIQATRPGAKVRRTTAIDEHHGALRFGFEVVGADGAILRHGTDFVLLDPERSRIQQVTGFFGDLAMAFSVKAIGHVESPLRGKEEAPKQGEEGSPLAVLVFDPSVQDALEGVRVGARLLLLTWLDRADRNVLRVHPRDDPAVPLRGVFSTRSQDRPNPVGVHRVTVVAVLDPLRFQVRDLEAFDGTPIIDVKAALEGFIE